MPSPPGSTRCSLAAPASARAIPNWQTLSLPGARPISLVEKYGIQPREHEWDRRWWSPIINAEHLAMRERAAMFDLTAFCVFDIVGPGALDCEIGRAHV